MALQMPRGDDKALYGHLDDFLRPEEKALFFLTWPQMFLVLTGIVLGGWVADKLALKGTANLLAMIVCSGAGLLLGIIHHESVPLYRIIGAILWYGWIRLRRGPTVVRSEDLWADGTVTMGGTLWIGGETGPIIQIGDESDLFRPRT